MIHLLTIIGARPQIIKAAAFSRAVAAWNNAHSPEEQVVEAILHTGQHYDDNMSAVFFAPMAEERSDILQRLQLADKQFVLATVHRPANTDDAGNLTNIMTALADIADSGIDVVLPLHPRTRKLLPDKLPASLLQRIEKCPHLKLTAPVSFFEIICLERHARLVMTDSGGVQKEAFFYGTPCVILRPETEWVEIAEAGAGIIADADYSRIMQAYNELSGRQVHFPPLFGDGHAAECILDAVVSYLSTATVQPA